jgi:O-antigen/teichoic acid export membrane protein
MLSGLLVVSLIDPESYGLFTGAGVYLGYILLGQGGIINGLSRELPYAFGAGNDYEAKKMASSVFFISCLISFIAGSVYFVFALKHFIQGDLLQALIFSSYTIIGGLHLLRKQFLPVLYRTDKDFGSLSKQNLLTGLGNLITVALVWWFGIYGLITRGAVLAVFEFYLLFKNKPYKLSFSKDLVHYKKLFETGLPIFVVGSINPLWTTLLNNTILGIAGPLTFGLYAISNIMQGAIGVIPSAFSQIFYPRMAIMLGQQRNVADIIKSHLKPLFFQFGVMLMLAIIGAILLPIVIPVILPKYIEGIAAAQWMLFVPVVSSFGALNNIYNVVKKQKLYLVSLVTGAITGSIFIVWRLNFQHFYLEVFPQGLIIGQSIQQILAIFFLQRILKND